MTGAGVSRGRSAAARLLVPVLVLAGLVMAFVIDPVVYDILAAKDEAARHAVESTDWYRLFRALGFLPTWFALAVVFLAVDLGRREPYVQPLRRATLVAVVPLLTGVAAEIVKILTRRTRPDPERAAEFFTAPDSGGFFAWFSSADLAFPSSHASVAFAAAFAVGFIHSRAALPMLALAACCGMTRIAAGAHNFSDVLGALLLGYAVARVVFAWDLRNNAAPP